MRRVGAILLFLISSCAGAYAFHLLSIVLELSNDAARYAKVMLLSDLGCVAFGLVLTIAFIITARGRWRLAAVLPLATCVLVGWVIISLL
jgi:hypothetical protein